MVETKKYVNVKVKMAVFTMVFPLSFSNAKICEVLDSAFDKTFAYNEKKFMFYVTEDN